MGSSQSSSTAEHPVSTLGVGTLVREIGMAMIPVHLRHSLESVMQILGMVTVTDCMVTDWPPLTRDSEQAEAV